MKKLLYILTFFSLACCSLISCSPEEDDIFSESAANRMTDKLAEYGQLLASAHNGWKMEYFSDNEQLNGGRTFLMHFGSGDSVTMAGDMADPTFRSTSLYSLIADAGPVLSFNSYNSLFHDFSEPKGSANTEGYGGDYEFTFMEATDSRIVLKGKKSGNRIILTRMAEDQDWTAYLENLSDIEIKSICGRYRVYIDGKERLVIQNADRNFVIPDTVDGIPGVVNVGFLYTPEGIKTYKPMEIYGAKVQNFTWDATTESLVSKEGGTEVRLEAFPYSYQVAYDEYPGEWVMKYDDGSGNNFVKNVTISVKKYGESFTLSGLRYDLILNYNKLGGYVYLNHQYVGMYQDYFMFICLSGDGYYTWDTGVMYAGIWDEQPGDMNIVFMDNGSWNHKVDGALLYAFSSQEAGGNNGVGSLERYMNITMTKK